ncbi:hypothetical protein [Stieleria neptunia]|nr:hypothetical protein [Stieleria neptunia]
MSTITVADWSSGSPIIAAGHLYIADGRGSMPQNSLDTLILPPRAGRCIRCLGDCDDVKRATITVSNRMMMAGDDPFGSPTQAFSMGTIELTESVRVVFELDAEKKRAAPHVAQPSHRG